MGNGGDSDGTFGGNGSVYWKVNIRNPKTSAPKAGKYEPDGYSFEGHDATPKAGSTFEITIRPAAADKQDVARAMRTAADEVEKSGKGMFSVRVEKGQHRQIHIKWRSDNEENFSPSVPSI